MQKLKYHKIQYNYKNICTFPGYQLPSKFFDNCITVYLTRGKFNFLQLFNTKDFSILA